jgi:glycosyltransferase involved in cell wall biosynthesis
MYLLQPTYAEKPGVHVLFNHKPSGKSYSLLPLRLLDRLRAYRPDVVITHDNFSSVLGHVAGAITAVTSRIAVHHLPVENNSFLSRNMDRAAGTLGFYTAQVAVSNAVVQSVSRYPDQYRESLCRVYNGIVLDQELGAVSEKYSGSLPSGPKILHVGRLNPQKNHTALVNTMRSLPNANLVLVGDGELRDSIQRQVKALGLGERIHFIGELAPDKVRGVMHACDLFMFPSLFEAMPMALLEAMSAGMPIIASDIPANRELLQDCGILLPPDPEQFAGAAARLLADHTTAAGLGERANRRATQFTVDAMADGYENLFLS